MVIKKVKGRYILYSRTSGRRLSKPLPSRAAALKRERQVQYWKRIKGFEFPIPIELLLIVMITVILGVSVLIPILQNAIASEQNVAIQGMYGLIILFSVLFDVVIIMAWLKIS